MKRILFLLLISAELVFSQVELFPDKLNIQPFTANFLEPKLGFVFQTNNNELRLDIGNSLDILQVDVSDNSRLSLGADLFTYTLLRSEKDFHFPVDAVDYLFGANIGYKHKFEKNEFGLRLRLSHISAHFVDGHFDHQSTQWRDGLSPRVYSREFIEAMPYFRIKDVRVYAGYTYLFHVDPTYIGRDIFQCGFDFFADSFPLSYIHPFLGYDLRLTKIQKYTGNNTLNAGVKIGSKQGRGFSVYYSYYSGNSIHGEYFDFKRNYNAIGFNLDL